MFTSYSLDLYHISMLLSLNVISVVMIEGLSLFYVRSILVVIVCFLELASLRPYEYFQL